jgi:NADPH-dependent curcumin reductase CurA
MKSKQIVFASIPLIHGFDKLPDTFIALFNGKNQGKILVETE